MTTRQSAPRAQYATPAAVASRVPALRRALLARRSALLGCVAHAEEDLRALAADIESELVEQAQEESTARLLQRLDDRGQTSLVAIDRALARIAAGRYGRCGVCGADIALARLAAVPEATTCVRCARGRQTAATA